jgi:hypothetical protein
MELCLDLRIVDDRHLQKVVLKHLDLPEVQLFWRDYDFGAIRICANIKKIRLIVVSADDIDV